MAKDRTGQKQYSKTTSQGFYMGNAEQKARRVESLTAAAELLGLRGASSLVAALGDIPPAELATAVGELIRKYKKEE